MKNNRQINLTDILYLTVTSGRRILASINLCGVRCLNEIYRYVSETLQGQKGVMTLYLRNSTQGWTQQHRMVLSSKTTPVVKSGQMQISSYPSLFGPESFEA